MMVDKVEALKTKQRLEIEEALLVKLLNQGASPKSELVKIREQIKNIEYVLRK